MSESKQFTYRNKTGVTQDLIGVGIVKAGETITVDEPVQNPNFELVDGDKQYHSKSEQRRVEATKPTAPTAPKDEE